MNMGNLQQLQRKEHPHRNIQLLQKIIKLS